jgi:replicative superfamily II helicase
LSSQNATKDERAGAAVVLDTLTNAPAIKLAVERRLLESEFTANIPMPLRLDMIRRRVAHSIVSRENQLLLFNRFQSNVFKGAPDNDWLSISVPTSAGKSFVLNKILEGFLREADRAHVVYIVPTRALIQQVELDLTSLLPGEQFPNLQITAIPQVPENWRDLRIVFVYTQERLHYLLNDAPPDFTFDVLLVDEAQKIDDGSRGILLQQTIEKVVVKSPQVKVIFSSPMTANPCETLSNSRGSNLLSMHPVTFMC